jgi:hypothetical protein
MPSRRFFSQRRRGVQSLSPPSNDSFPDGPSITIVQHTPPDLPTAPQALYPDYLNESTGPGWDAAVAVTSIMKDIPAVPLALITPLTQVLDVVSGIRKAVETMRDGKDGCAHLIFRVVKFLHSLVDGLKGRNIPDSTPTASSLFILKRSVFQIPCTFSVPKYNSFPYGYSNLMAIHTDAARWSRLNLVKRYVQRDKIMSAISMHGENLTDCLRTFQVSDTHILTSRQRADVIIKIVTSITATHPPDRVQTIAFPGPPVSARPLAASENTPVSNPSRSIAVRSDDDPPSGFSYCSRIS